jgi:hypothetical protein
VPGRAEEEVISRQVRIGRGRGSHVGIKKANTDDGEPGQDGCGGTIEGGAVSGRLGS